MNTNIFNVRQLLKPFRGGIRSDGTSPKARLAELREQLTKQGVDVAALLSTREAKRATNSQKVRILEARLKPGGLKSPAAAVEPVNPPVAVAPITLRASPGGAISPVGAAVVAKAPVNDRRAAKDGAGRDDEKKDEEEEDEEGPLRRYMKSTDPEEKRKLYRQIFPDPNEPHDPVEAWTGFSKAKGEAQKRRWYRKLFPQVPSKHL